MHNEVQIGIRDSDEPKGELVLCAEDAAPPGPVDDTQLPELIAEAMPEVLGRLVLAVAAQHDPGGRGWCLVCVGCRPRRWGWWRGRRPGRGGEPCPTQRLLWAELHAATGPQFTSA